MTTDNVHQPSTGDTVIWRGKDCMVTRRYPNGKLIISPKGNGQNPAQYFTVHEQDVKLKHI